MTSQQIRADNEPSTLVSLCPTHGSIGEIACRYIRLSNHVVIDHNPSLTSTQRCLLNTYSIQSLPSSQWVECSSLVLCRLRVSQPVTFPSEWHQYLSIQLPSAIDGIHYITNRHFSHPLFNISLNYEDGIGCITMSTSTLGPFTIETVRLVSGLDRSVHNIAELESTKCYFELRHYPERHCTLVYSDRIGNEQYEIACIGLDASIVIDTIQMCYYDIAGISTFLGDGYKFESWARLLCSRNIVTHNKVIFIPQDMVVSDTSGSFISSDGHSRYIYIENGFILLINTSTMKVTFPNILITGITNDIKGLYRGYVSRTNIYLDSALTSDSTHINSIVGLTDAIREVDRTYSSHWREFIPHALPNVRLKSTNRYNVDTINVQLHIFQEILCGILLKLMRDLGTNHIIIHGRPIHAFMPLVERYNCYYVVGDPVWDDEVANMYEFYGHTVYYSSDIVRAVEDSICGDITIVKHDLYYEKLPMKIVTVYMFPEFDHNEQPSIKRTSSDTFIYVNNDGTDVRPCDSREFVLEHSNIARIYSALSIELPHLTIYHSVGLEAYLFNM